MRTVIVHYHIFKNAGTSIDHVLRAAFGEKWASLEGPTATSLLRPSDLSAFVEQRREVCAVSSHLLRPPAPADLVLLPVVLLRDPLDRAYSVYRHHRRRTDGELWCDTVARRSSFRQFVRSCLDHKALGGMVIADYQVIHLSPASFRNGHVYRAIATEDDLRHAIAYLERGPCFGTVDRFDAAVASLCEMAGALDLTVQPLSVAENVTPGRPSDLDARVSIARRALGPSLYRRFRRENGLDYRLYEWARASAGRRTGQRACAAGSKAW